MGKRLASIRRGIRYQDLVAAEALLEMVNGDPDPPLSVRLEDRRGGSFDDVVVIYADRVVWKQVKWAQHPGAEPLTIESLSASERGRKPPIRKFADSFRQISSESQACELELITNRSPDPELRRLLSGRTSRLKARLTTAQREQLSAAWTEAAGLDSTQFKALLRTLSFLVNSPDIERREKELRTQLRLLGCAETAFGQLLDAIWEWAQDEEKEALTPTDVEAVLGRGFDTPSNEFQLPIVYVVRPEARRELLRRIDSLKSGYLVLLGSPGSGKSTLLNTVEDHDAPHTRNDFIVYNCFTGTSDSFLRTRARADNFTKFLARQLHERYGASGLTFQTSAEAIETLLARASGALREGHKLILVVDGLDYARRFAPENTEGLFTSLPPNLPENVVIVASAQVKEQLPSHLQNLDSSRFIEVPPLDRPAVDTLLENHGVYAAARLTANDRQDLCRKVWALTAGHALHVSYAARQLATAVREGGDPAAAITAMPNCHGDIEQYYRTLFAPAEAAIAREALSVMATCPFELSMPEVAAAMSPPADPREVDDALRPFRHVFQRIGGRYYFSHDSLRVFADRQFEGAGFSIGDQIAFLSRLENDPRVGDHLLHQLATVDEGAAAAEGVDCDWLSRQIAAGTNLGLLDEGLMLMALAELKRENWGRMARWWSLQACLHRAEFEGELTEATLINAWLATKRLSLVERYIFVSTQFLSRVYPGPDLVDFLDEHGQSELAERLRDRELSQSPPPIDPSGVIDEFAYYVRHASRRMSAAELLPTIRARADRICEQRDVNGFPMLREPSEKAAEYIDSIVRERLHAKDLDRAEEWLEIDPTVLSDALRAEHYLRLRLLRGDLADNSERVNVAIEAVESLSVLAQLAATGDFDEDVRSVVQSFDLNPLLRNQVQWYDRRQLYSATADLLCDVSICSRLHVQERLEEVYQAARSVNCRVGQTFTVGIARLTESVTSRPAEWKLALETFAAAIRRLEHERYTFDDINAAQAFVCGVGDILRPVACCAKEVSAEAEFAAVVESQFIPALVKARINYEGGHLSISDMLQAEGLCGDFALQLLATVEDRFTESMSFKSGNLVDLAARYARAGDMSAAERVLIVGVRAAFTYGYRKDTTLNEFLVAFDSVAPYLGTRFTAIAELVARAIIVVDTLTDGRMLMYASSYFVAVVCRHDLPLAARLAQCLWTRCRSLRPTWLRQAAGDQGVDLSELAPVFAEHAPDVPLDSTSEEDQDGQADEHDPRHDFVTSDADFSEAKPQLAAELERVIEQSAFASAFHNFPGLIKAFAARGETDAALAVFAEFERALRQLLAPYPLPDLD